MKINYAVQSVKGLRKENQDNFLADGHIRQTEQQDCSESGTSDDIYQSYVVCDGMGGEEKGAEVSLLAVKKLNQINLQELPGNLRRYLTELNKDLVVFQQMNQCTSGSTIAGVLISPETVNIFNVGDSRVYRVSSGGIEQLSKDHTEFQMMVDAGIFRKEDFHKTKLHNYLTQYLGMEEEEVELDPYTIEVEPEDPNEVYLICSDGLYGSLTEGEILDIIGSRENLAQCCQDLVDAALSHGSRDNVTGLLIQIMELPDIFTEELTEEIEIAGLAADDDSETQSILQSCGVFDQLKVHQAEQKRRKFPSLEMLRSFIKKRK